MKKIEHDRISSDRKPNGVNVPKDLYEQLTELILACINKNQDGSIAFNDLIEQVSKNINKDFYGVLPWYLLQVKRDLEERGLIKTTVDKKRKQMIEINPRNKRKS